MSHRAQLPLRPGAVTRGEQESGCQPRVLRQQFTRLRRCEIGSQLCASTNTFKTHARSIYRRLNASVRAEAVAGASPVRPVLASAKKSSGHDSLRFMRAAARPLTISQMAVCRRRTSERLDRWRSVLVSLPLLRRDRRLGRTRPVACELVSAKSLVGVTHACPFAATTPRRPRSGLSGQAFRSGRDRRSDGLPSPEPPPRRLRGVGHASRPLPPRRPCPDRWSHRGTRSHHRPTRRYRRP